jgi:hypothetical protein
MNGQSIPVGACGEAPIASVGLQAEFASYLAYKGAPEPFRITYEQLDSLRALATA